MVEGSMHILLLLLLLLSLLLRRQGEAEVGGEGGGEGDFGDAGRGVLDVESEFLGGGGREGGRACGCEC
jgi:hypothetical protein